MLYLKQNTNGGFKVALILELVLQSATFIHQLGAICGALGRLSDVTVPVRLFARRVLVSP
jgi:hypothetical protein